MFTFVNMKTSDKILLYVAKNKKQMSKFQLAIELGISRPTLDKKLSDNFFNDTEIWKLKQLGIIAA